MPPTAEVSVARWNRDSCRNDVTPSHTTVPNRDTGRHGYFQSPYVRGAAGADRSPVIDSPKRQTIRQGVRPNRHSTGCILPDIDSHRNKTRSVHSGSPPVSPVTSVTSRRGGDRTVPPPNTSSTPPKKQSRMSMPSSSSSRDVTTDGSGQFPTVDCRDSASVSGYGRQGMRQTTDDDDGVGRDDRTQCESRVGPVSPPRSILALYRCHDCSMENIRTFTDGVEQDTRGGGACPQQRIGRRISRLMPSAAATTVLRGLSLSPRASMVGIDDNTVDQSALASGRPSTDRGCALSWDDRKCVRFEPNVRVFCDETSATEIHPLRSESENLTEKSTTYDVDLLFPPLHTSTEMVSMFSDFTGGDLPAVVKRYMVRCSNQQQQQRESSRCDAKFSSAGPDQ